MPLNVSSTMCSSSGGAAESSLYLCTERPPTAVMIPDAV